MSSIKTKQSFSNQGASFPHQFWALTRSVSAVDAFGGLRTDRFDALFGGYGKARLEATNLQIIVDEEERLRPSEALRGHFAQNGNIDSAWLSDQAHDRLRALPWDVSLYVLSVIACAIDNDALHVVPKGDDLEKHGVYDWLREGGTPTGHDSTSTWNTTKHGPWLRWMKFLGLVDPMANVFNIAPRLGRELARENGPRGRLAASQFRAWFSEHFPSLDGPLRLFVWNRFRPNESPPAICRIAARSLAELSDQGTLKLHWKVKNTDATDVLDWPAGLETPGLQPDENDLKLECVEIPR